MNITVDEDPSFSPSHFQIYPFYGESTCFCWSGQKLAVLPYVKRSKATAKIFIAPDEIRQVQCYSGRIFIICSPRGVYKFSKDGCFAVLSKSAIGISTLFYEVFTLRNGYLCLENKKDGTSTQLFHLPPFATGFNEFCVLSLNAAHTDKEFLDTANENRFSDQDICIIGYQKKLWKLVKGTVYLLYKHTYPISQVVPVLHNAKIKGLILVSEKDSLIIVYSNGSKLMFQEAYLGAKVEAICAGFSHEIPNTVWIVYSYDNSLFFAKKQLSTDSFHKMRIKDNSVNCLKSYDSKTVLILTRTRELLELSMENIERTFSLKDNTFIDLHKDMIPSSRVILNRIFDNAEVLEKINWDLVAAQEKLQRISLYSQKRKIRVCPEISLSCLCKDLFLAACFKDVFPKNCLVVLSLSLKHLTMFCSKKVISSNITVELQVPRNITAKDSKINIDLVTLPYVEKPWCLMRNCINEKIQGKRKATLKSGKLNFLNAKLAILRKHAKKGVINMKKLSEIKRSIRKELGEA